MGELVLLASIYLASEAKFPINTLTGGSLFPYETHTVIGLEQTPVNTPSVIKVLMFLLNLAPDYEFDTNDLARDVNNSSFITHERMLVICFLRPPGIGPHCGYSA